MGTGTFDLEIGWLYPLISALSESLPEPHGAPRSATARKIGRITTKIRNFTVACVSLPLPRILHPSAAVSFISHFRVGCWLLLMATPPGRLPEPHGTPRNGKIEKLRIESGILRIPGPSFRFSVCVTHPRWFRLYAIGRGGLVYFSFPRRALGVNGQNQSGWVTQTENRKDEPEIRKIPDSIRNSPILPFRGVPWRSVGFRETL